MDMPTFLIRYGFDLAQQEAEDWVVDWSQRFPVQWIPMALLEALYQGRYKAASVEQLLMLWGRRGEPRLGFSLEFSRRIWPDQQEQIAILLEKEPIPSPPRHHRFTSAPVPISTQELLTDLQPLSPKLLRLIHTGETFPLSGETESEVDL